jgi:hypothetical protein
MWNGRHAVPLVAVGLNTDRLFGLINADVFRACFQLIIRRVRVKLTYDLANNNRQYNSDHHFSLRFYPGSP